MKANLARGLKQLERVRAADLEADRHREQEEEGRSAVEGIRGMLRTNGFQSGRDESLASTFARFVGISYQGLKIQLAERAPGRL